MLLLATFRPAFAVPDFMGALCNETFPAIGWACRQDRNFIDFEYDLVISCGDNNLDTSLGSRLT
jgi:hypothetical protein